MRLRKGDRVQVGISQGELEQHSSPHYTFLGDCWLVRFPNQTAQWVSVEDISPLPRDGQLSLFENDHD